VRLFNRNAAASPDLRLLNHLFCQMLSVQMHMNFIGNMPNGAQLRQALVIPPDKFVDRWAAD
jgi:hypothetical protein